MERAVKTDGSERKGIRPPGGKWEENEGTEQESEVAGAGNTSPPPGTSDGLGLLLNRTHLGTSSQLRSGAAMPKRRPFTLRGSIGAKWIPFLQGICRA